MNAARIYLYCFILLVTAILFAPTARAVDVDIIKNGNFVRTVGGTVNDWTDWAFSASVPPPAGTFLYAPNSSGPFAGTNAIATLNLTQSGLTGLKAGPGALGAAKVTINMGWNICSVAPIALEVYVAGTLYAKFKTTSVASDGTIGTITYSNGATGTAASALPSTPYLNWVYRPWVINLPTTVANSGDIRLSFVQDTLACDADISVNSMSVQVSHATLKLTKTSNGGTGAFSFTGDNGFGTSTITTTTQGTAVSSTAKTLSADNTITTVSESPIPAGYAVSALSCTGLGTGTATASLATGTVVLNAAATAPTNNVICNYTNAKLPTIRLSKTSIGGVGTFNFTGDNGFGTDAITTTTQGTAVNGTLKTLSAASTSTVIKETIPAGYAVTAISCTGVSSANYTPNLATGEVTLDATATAPGSVISCSYTNAKLPTVRLSKTSNGGVGTFNFTGGNGFGTDAIITTTQGTAVNGTLKTLSAASTSTVITETLTAGYAVTAITCTGLGTGGTATSNLAARSVTLDAAATSPGSVISCSYTNVKLPTVQLSKTSNGGVGTFNFNGTNGFGTDAIITTTQGAAVNGTLKTLSAASTSTAITEAIPSGYVVTAISCTGVSSTNYTTNLVTGVVALNTTATAPGSVINCSFTNVKLPTVQLSKTSYGGVGTFNFSGTNGFGTDAIITTTQGTAVNGIVKVLSSFNTTTILSETISSTYFLSGLSCTGLGSGAAVYDLTAGTITLNSAATAPGNAISCNYSNTLSNPSLSVVKSANTEGPVSAGQVITYSFMVTNNGNRPISNVTLTELFNGTGTPPTISGETLLTDAAPTGDSINGTANDGIWQTLGVGDVVKYTAAYTVTQSDIETRQ